ncbi:phenylalanine tRNA synthetase, beta subunit [Wigglesworthia glossinidia endosymbiont of Glossina morsitans morsitans (Yale colony)]|uniref:Phenylalanine--tRNA ligase beta subunit n=1 Tax=Wigglesworthia glossinidia endosymbiont of Glossina morsitans morsitans (Yale colony) TaxID=1142511 RepID=H6Q5P6_WIGGL|nr:phenylalanine--tRNA ligase subunit beta [Wigglesworthia glossinidia]AFA40950.1 phenylalanine tRNA synthetase, beta subunit [Wigglesworthia glossinidia endosymbiont of Glossina morsitans morsitans (Yale colony)]
MKCSLSWLKEWIQHKNIKLNTIINKIQKIGLEIDKISPILTQFSGIKIGEVISCKIHPNNKSFNLYSINIGNTHTVKIVSQFKKNLLHKKVAIALNGAKIKKDTIVKNKIIFGKQSEGIICSYEDLKIFGIQKKSQNIVVFPQTAPVGKDVKKYFLLNDTILDISITPNRFDCLNLLGLSRAIKSQANNMLLKKKYFKPILPTNNIKIKTNIFAPEACPKYLSRTITDINLNVNTPVWISERLKRSGYIPKNVLIDIIYYVFIETGQPIKIFDMHKSSCNTTIRYTNQNEHINVSQEKKIFLDKNTLVISNENKILEIAGLIISNDVKININTTDILISAAFYNGKFIYDLSKKYNIQSEFTEKYIKNMVDPNIQFQAIERTTELIIKCCHGSPGKINYVTFENFLPQNKKINLRKNRIKKVLGFFIKKYKVEEILYSLKYQLKHKKNQWSVIPPSWRVFNVSNEIDVINDIACFYEFEKIPLQPDISGFNVQKKIFKNVTLYPLKQFLVSRGYQEVITYTFVDPKIQKILYPKRSAIPIINPISHDMSVLRLSLWTNFIKTILYNQSRQVHEIRIFESGFCFIPNKKYTFGIHQKFVISGAISENSVMHWKLKEKLDFYDVKGDIEALIGIYNNLEFLKFISFKNSILHPGKSAKIFIKDKCVGLIGEINPFLKKFFKLKNKIFLFELSWKLISNNYVPKIQNVSDFPYNQRDISIIVSHNIPAMEIIRACKNKVKNKLINIGIFDLYQGNKIKYGFKSISIRLTLQDQYTMTNKEINMIIEKCIQILKNKFNAEIRHISEV